MYVCRHVSKFVCINVRKLACMHGCRVCSRSKARRFRVVSSVCDIGLDSGCVSVSVRVSCVCSNRTSVVLVIILGEDA